MSMMVSFVLSFFPRDVLDEILNLIESVSEDFPSYSCSLSLTQMHLMLELAVYSHRYKRGMRGGDSICLKEAECPTTKV